LSSPLLPRKPIASRSTSRAEQTHGYGAQCERTDSGEGLEQE